MYCVSHQLGQLKLGIYSISAFLYYLFSFLTSFELTSYFGKEVAHLRDRADSLKKLYGEAATTFVLGVGLSLAAAVVLFFFYHPIAADVLVLSALSGMIFGIEKNLSGILLGQEKMQFEFLAQAAAFLITALPVLFFTQWLDITGIYILRIAASVLTILLRKYLAGIGKSLYQQALKFKQYNWKEISFFAASGFAYFVQHHFDLFVLSYLISLEQEGAYFLALRIYLSFCLLAEMTSFALTPYISRVYRNKETPESEPSGNFHGFYKKILLSGTALGVLASVTLFFSRDLLLGFFSGNNSAQSSDYLFYFSFFLFFRFVSYYTGNILTATRYQNIRFYILISSSTLLMGLEVLLGKFLSVKGIIYARGFAEFFIFVAYLTAVACIKRSTLKTQTQ